ncbi:MAG: hypothetical protein V1834_04285, partial [Candidatus Micrarchaeota archaeon]
MNRSLKVGLGFGITSAIITTLGLIVGLNAGTHSKLVLIGGILTIAVADAFSDALGIHVSQESQKGISAKEVWEATFSTWFFKLLFGLTFVVPFLFLEVDKAVFACLAWGFLLLGAFSYYVGLKDHKPWNAVAEHLVIAVVVIVITNFIGG